MNTTQHTDAYLAGYDAGLNGVNIANAHFGYFRTKESLADWEKGKLSGELEYQKINKPKKDKP